MQLSGLQVSVFLSFVWCEFCQPSLGLLKFFHIGTIYIETFYMILGLIGVYNRYPNQTFTHNNHKRFILKIGVYISIHIHTWMHTHTHLWFYHSGEKNVNLPLMRWCASLFFHKENLGRVSDIRHRTSSVFFRVDWVD